MKVLVGFLKAIGVFLSIIISVIVFAVTSVTIFLWSAAEAFSPDSIKEIIQSIDITSGDPEEAPTSLGSSGFMAELTLKDSTTVLVPLENESDPLGSFSIDKILETPEIKEMLDGLREEGIDVDALITIVKDDVIGEIVADFAEGLTEYLVDGETDIVIDADYIIELAESVKPKFEEVLGESFPDDVWNELKSTITEVSEEITTAIPSYEQIAEDISGALENSGIPGGMETVNSFLAFLFSNLSIIIPVAILLALALLIALFRFSPFRWLCWMAVPMLISGLIFLAVSLSASAIASAIPAVEGIDVGTIITILFSSMTFNSALFIGISIVFFIAYGIFCSVAKKIKAKRAAKKEAKKVEEKTPAAEITAEAAPEITVSAENNA